MFAFHKQYGSKISLLPNSNLERAIPWKSTTRRFCHDYDVKFEDGDTATCIPESMVFL
jgi:hypothetical protein